MTWRDRWLDTTPGRPAFGVERQPAILAEVRACVARYTVATTRPEQLLGLGTSYLALDDTVHAAEAFDRVIRLGANLPLERRAWDLSRIVDAYAKAEWAAQAVAYMAKLDALGPAAAGRRLQMHDALYLFASGLDSIPFMIAQVDGARAAMKDLRDDERLEWLDDLQSAGEDATDLEGRRSNFTAMQRVAEQFRTTLDSIRPGYGSGIWGPRSQDIRGSVLRVGKPVPPLVSDFVFLKGQTAPSTAPFNRPRTGKVSLVLYFWELNPGGGDMVDYQMLEDLRRKYSPDVLDITITTSTRGYDLDQLRNVPDPKEEGKLIRGFFHDYMKLTIPVSVRVRSYTVDPQSGRREEVNVEDVYRDGKYTLIDKSGIIRDVHGGGKRLSNMIRELLREP